MLCARGKRRGSFHPFKLYPAAISAQTQSGDMPIALGCKTPALMDVVSIVVHEMSMEIVLHTEPIRIRMYSYCVQSITVE